MLINYHGVLLHGIFYLPPSGPAKRCIDVYFGVKLLHSDPSYNYRDQIFACTAENALYTIRFEKDQNNKYNQYIYSV